MPPICILYLGSSFYIYFSLSFWVCILPEAVQGQQVVWLQGDGDRRCVHWEDRTAIYHACMSVYTQKAQTFVFGQVFLNNHIWTFGLWKQNWLRKADGVRSCCPSSYWVLWWCVFSDCPLQFVAFTSRSLPRWRFPGHDQLGAVGRRFWKTTGEPNSGLI